jgi:TP901 family phage tail tape measure protein
LGKASITISVSSVFNGNGFDKAIDGATKLGNKLSRMEKLTAQNANSMTSNIAKAGAQLEKLGSKMADSGDKLTKSLTVPMVAAGAYAGKMAVDFDTALANVRKTSDLTEAELDDLAKSALELSKTQPVDAQTILNIEALGAQLGISNGKLETFAKTVSGLDIATNMNAETAATEMARFANIVGMTEDKFSNYGSTLVAIGNNMATTESEVSQMAQRFASAGAQAGLSEAQILGMAGAMSSLGIKAEMGGSALSQIFVSIGKSVANGGADLDAFAKRANMSADEFRKAWGEDAAGAFNALIDGIGNATAAGEDMNVIMGELGFTQIRQSDVMRRLAGSTEAVTGKQSVLADALKLSTEAWEQNTALQNEVDQRNESMASRLQVLKNKIDAIAITVGRPLVEAVIDALDAFDPLIQGVADAAQAFADMDEAGQRNAIMLAGLAAGAGPFLSVTGRLVQGVGSATSKLAVFTDAMLNLDGANLRTYGSSKSLASAMGLAQNAAVKAAGGVDNYVKAWDGMVTAADKVKKAEKAMNDLLEECGGTLDNATKAQLRRASALEIDYNKAEAAYKANAKLVTAFGNSTKEAEKAAKGIKSLKPALDDVKSASVNSATVLDAHNKKLEETAAKAKAAAKGADGFGVALKAVAMQLPNIMLATAVAASVGVLAAAFAKCEENARKAAERQEALTKAQTTFADVAGGVSATAGMVSTAYDDIAKSARESLNAVAEMNSTATETLTQFETSSASLEHYVSVIEQLGAKGSLTATEQGKLSMAVEGYNKITGDSVTITDAAKGALSKSSEQISDNARAWEENARAQALQSVAQGYIEAQVQAEIELKSATDAYNRALAEKELAYQRLQSAAAAGRTATQEEQKAYEDACNAVIQMKGAVEEAQVGVDSASQSASEAMAAMALNSSNLAESVKNDIAAQELCYQDFAIAVATSLQESGQSVGTFQENLAALGADTSKMRQIGSANFDQLWKSCNGDVGLMIQKINEYNGTDLNNKDADVQAHGNVPNGSAKQATDDAKKSINNLKDKEVKVEAKGNFDSARHSIWDLGNAIGNLFSKNLNISANGLRTKHASGGIALHAAGGIATRATDITRHIAGEAGAEAIVPLTNRHYVTPFAQVVAQETVAAMRGGSTAQRAGNTYVLNINGTQIQSMTPRVMEAVEVIFHERELMNMMGVR